MDPHSRCRRRALALLVILAIPAPTLEAGAALVEGDRAWAARDRRVEDGLAEPAKTEQAIEAYAQVCRSESPALEPCWKLLRALNFLTEFTSASEARKDRAARQAAELADRLDERDLPSEQSVDAGRLYFWSAIAWGARGKRVGLLTIVREGVAGQIRDFAQRAIEIEPSIERGGAQRLLSRLHAELPRVPFVTGWVERDRALPLAERAHAIDPDDPGNRLILALALLEQGPEERRGEARELLRSVAGLEPRPSLRVEDLKTREQARERLQELEERMAARQHSG